MCARCEELEEEVAYLKSELGLQLHAGHVAVLADHIRQVKRSCANSVQQAAELVLALRAARGRPLTRYQLLDAVPSPSGRDDRDEGIVSVWVWCARSALGRDAIANVWGKGYRLTDVGVSAVSEILGEKAA